MPELQMSQQVRALLGPEGVARAAEVSLADGTCVYCRTCLEGTVNMVVRTNGTFVHVVYVHAACGPSEVVPLPDDHQPPVPADGYDMTMTAAVLDHDGTNLPVLVAETVAKAYAFDGSSGPGPIPELTSVVASSLLGDGFTLISRITQEAPPQIPEWVGVLLLGHGPAGEDGLLVLDPEGGKFYAGSVELPDSWLPAAAHYGWAVLYVGDVGLAELRGDDKDAVKALRAAAQAGRLVGARIAIGVPPPNTAA
ncbi:hypothetical protein [Streptomyces sp. RLA2-12]|uniref:hypothetical protein n=1 Tax=Streptomyces sp. RLA2-12 TaxID=2721242 RepID=UPI00145EFAB1|nr:hypothetical protein [Streptomyces sp. RLA2-12]NMI63189.1 hypothetical protein [Streptomyces sp. RLA2-12]